MAFMHIFYFPMNFTGELRNKSFLQKNDCIFWFIRYKDLAGRLFFVAKPYLNFVKIDEANLSSEPETWLLVLLDKLEFFDLFP